MRDFEHEYLLTIKQNAAKPFAEALEVMTSDRDFWRSQAGMMLEYIRRLERDSLILDGATCRMIDSTLSALWKDLGEAVNVPKRT